MIRFNLKAYNALKNISINDYEIGGIIGGRKNTVFVVCFDKMEIQYNMGVYTANVEYLNSVISKWQNDSIEFYGIFHTHINGVRELSKGDIDSIYAIMNDLPNDISKLYFPLIIPNNKVLLYSAERLKHEIKITKEKVVLKGETNEKN